MDDLKRLHATARIMPIEAWHTSILDSAKTLNPQMPGYPNHQVQLWKNGRPAVEAMQQAFDIYRLASGYFGSSVGKTFLDFGAGWGRIWRYFLHDYAPDRMFAFDVVLEQVPFWQDHMMGAKIDMGEPFKPLPYANETIDNVLSNSVFSHLSEKLNLYSIKELHRVMKPGGIFVGTIFGKWHLKRWKQWQQDGGDLLPRQKMLAALTDDFDGAISRLRGGEFVYLETGQSTCLLEFEISAFSDKWITKNWSEWFDLIEYQEQTTAGQALFAICRK